MANKGESKRSLAASLIIQQLNLESQSPIWGKNRMIISMIRAQGKESVDCSN